MNIVEKTQSGPKYAQVIREIKQGMADGRFPPGAMLESEKQLCDRFGVSRGTVRQALDVLEREELINRMPGSGSFVRGGAFAGESSAGVSSAEARPTQRQINILFDTSAGSLDDNFVDIEIIEGLNRAIAQLATRYRLNYQFCRFEEELGSGTISNLKSPLNMFASNSDGLLVIPFTQHSTEMISRHQPIQVPLVSFFDRVENPAVSQVYLDHETAARRATELLLQFGHRRVDLLMQFLPPRKPAIQQRHEGYRSAMEAQGEAEPTVVETGREPSSMRRIIRELLERPDRPTALLATGGMLTTPMMQAVTEAGLTVPDDLSVIVADDTTDARVRQPPLSVIKQPLMQGAFKAVELMLELIEGKQSQPRTCVLEPDLMMRGSVTMAPPQDA